MATATLFDVSNGTSTAAWRQGPFYYGNGSRILKVFYVNKN